MKTAVYVTNRLPQARLRLTIPKVLEYQVHSFRVFGCVCYVFLPNHLRSKYSKKLDVGYDSERKGWRCCDPTTNRCYTSRNVVFDEVGGHP